MTIFYDFIQRTLQITKFRLSSNTVNCSVVFCKCFRKMSTITPSVEVRGMKILDRQRFEKTVNVPALMIPESDASTTIKLIKKYLLKLDNFKPIQSIESPSTKVAFLNPFIIQYWTDISPEDRESLLKCGVCEGNLSMKEVSLTYENWKADEILKAVLPTDKDNLTSYSIIGHIVHVNLKDHHLEYKKLIGDVLLDKVKHCKTVVNKTNTIDNTYRNFSMEILAGEQNFQTLVKENNCSFEFDFSSVYWNPRLCTEHERIIKMLKAGDILFDVFAGVGPFAIPVLRKKCKVYANDLNPESYKWLCHNAKLNKVLGPNFKAFNLDGRCFIRDVFIPYLIETLNCSDVCKPDIHLTMNLPALAVEFLDVFGGILKGHALEDSNKFREPIVHVYCFVDGTDPIETSKQMVEKNLGYKLGKNLIDIFFVRNVSPKKDMMRVSFRLSLNILFGNEDDVLSAEENICNEYEYEPQNKLKKI